MPTSYTPEDPKNPAGLLEEFASILVQFSIQMFPNSPSDDAKRENIAACTDISLFRHLLDRWPSMSLTARADNPCWKLSRELNMLTYSDFVKFSNRSGHNSTSSKLQQRLALLLVLALQEVAVALAQIPLRLPVLFLLLLSSSLHGTCFVSTKL